MRDTYEWDQDEDTMSVHSASDEDWKEMVATIP